ncbi:MAG: alpha-galactosidase [Alteromonadaceae bacterium]|nr:alpha-galactosidase [Alteromonadaceae bacterium]
MHNSELLTIKGKHTCMIFSLREGMPELIHWGKHLSNVQGALLCRDKPVPQGGLDEVPPLTLSGDIGRGLFCPPGLQGHREGLDWSPIFKVTDIQQNEHEVTFMCDEAIAKLQLKISIAIDAKTDVASWETSLTNLSDSPYQLHRLFITLPVPAHMNQLRSFGGRWCQEFKQHDVELEHGAIRIESRHGRTSHQKSPFWQIGQPGFSNCQGEMYGLHLAWSGNHCFNFEVTSDGRYLVQVGELLLPGEKSLTKDETYTTPKLLLSYSDQGTNALSQQFHSYVRSNILQWPSIKPRPVLLNTWEGIYFDHDPNYIIKMVEASAQLGVERFVLDDGWFRGRNNEDAALGDWQLDEDKYPDGLEPVINAVVKNGMEFGIWVEPEMVNPNSDLYRAHPDWAMHIPGYYTPLGRYQQVLNLQIPEAFDYIFNCLDELLSKYDVSYVKWDMNRQLVQAAHEGKAGTCGQTRAFYRLISALRDKHPDVEIESCASGGGRVDMGVLEYTHRFWTSDCNDALERVSIQNGFSQFFPLELMGAHIGADEAHTTKRRHNSQFRGTVALFGHLGLELDPVKATSEEIYSFKEHVALHKELRPLLHAESSRFYRLDSVNDESIVAWMVTSDDAQRAVVAYFQTAMQKHSVPPLIPLNYLNNDSVYDVNVLVREQDIGYAMKREPAWMRQSTQVGGEWLNQKGLQLPVLYPETALLVELNAMEK